MLLSLKSRRLAAKGIFRNNNQMRRRDRTTPMPQDTKDIIQFEHIHHEQVAEKQQAALRAKFEEYLSKQKAAYKKRTTLHGAIGGEEQQKRVQSISEYQTEVETELDVEEEKAAEIKNQVQTAKNSREAQQHRAATASKEVAEMQQE